MTENIYTSQSKLIPVLNAPANIGAAFHKMESPWQEPLSRLGRDMEKTGQIMVSTMIAFADKLVKCAIIFEKLPDAVKVGAAATQAATANYGYFGRKRTGVWRITFIKLGVEYDYVRTRNISVGYKS